MLMFNITKSAFGKNHSSQHPLPVQTEKKKPRHEYATDFSAFLPRILLSFLRGSNSSKPKRIADFVAIAPATMLPRQEMVRGRPGQMD